MNKVNIFLYFLFFSALFPVSNALSQINTQAVGVAPLTIDQIVVFDDYFIPKTLRIDYIMAGDNQEVVNPVY